MPPWSPDTYLKALHFAAEAHAGQVYAADHSKPYLLHLSLVAAEVMAALSTEAFAQPDLAVQCALLHDILEDTQVSFEQLEQNFGIEVARGVQALTKDPALPKEQRMADSLRRIQVEAIEVWLVKLADRITNLQPPPKHWSSEKIREYRAEAIQILRALSPASPYLAQRLKAKIEAYGAFE